MDANIRKAREVRGLLSLSNEAAQRVCKASVVSFLVVALLTTLLTGCSLTNAMAASDSNATNSYAAGVRESHGASEAPRVADPEVVAIVLEEQASGEPVGTDQLADGQAANGANVAAGLTGASVETPSLFLDVAGVICEIPPFDGAPAVEINNGQPMFTDDDLAQPCVETYSKLDRAGRCGSALAHICEATMPTEERGDIQSVHPSGWQSAQYDFIEGGSLYNRGHLIGFQLAGENANEKNLITCTRYMNVEGMLPFENKIANFVMSTGLSVLLRVTPIFEGDNLVASGVVMEAMSVEDAGAGLAFHVYCYNVQPGVAIDYATGESEVDPDALAAQMLAAAEGSEGFDSSEAVGSGVATASGLVSGAQASESGVTSAETSYSYVANKNTKKFHFPSCSSVSDMAAHNRWDFDGTRDDLINQGYVPCKRCNP